MYIDFNRASHFKYIYRGNTMNAKFLSKDKNCGDGTTTYWFDLNGETYGVIEGGKSCNSNVVDFEGYPTDDVTADQFEITDEMRAE